MVTKTFCDHCGNVVGSNFKKIDIQASVDITVGQFTHAVPAGIPFSGSGHHVMSAGALPGYTPTPTYTLWSVDLCPHCESVWLSRVKKLTTHEKQDVNFP